MPFLLLAMSVLPALIVVGVVVLTGLDSLPVSYADYTNQTQLLVSLFVAAQAPVLFSRDLRLRSIVLYLARPLSAPVFALMRWLSLTVALLLFMAVPTLLLFVGALLSGLDKSDQVTAAPQGRRAPDAAGAARRRHHRPDLLGLPAPRLRGRRLGDGADRAHRRGHRRPGDLRGPGRRLGVDRRRAVLPLVALHAASPTRGTRASTPSCRSTAPGHWRTPWSRCWSSPPASWRWSPASGRWARDEQPGPRLGLALVRQRRRRQRRLDDHRPRRHRPARPQRRRQDHADRDDGGLPRAVRRARHARRPAALAQHRDLPPDRPGARARAAASAT